MVKNSRKRETIRTILKNTDTHPSAETIYLQVKNVYPNISLGTVYRNLNQLIELGEIEKVSGTVGSDRFDGNPKPHNHFFCTCCDAIIDLPDLDGVNVEKEMQKQFQGRITGHVTNYYGTCPNCM